MIIDPVEEFIRAHAGESIYCPKRLKKRERNDAVIADYDRLISGKGAEEVIDIITRTHYISASTVRRILKRRGK